MTWMVWSNIGAAGGESLGKIASRKEAERKAGGGNFWWGLGSRLGPAVADTATSNGGVLPAVFSKILGPPPQKDADPDEVCIWNSWQSADGRERGAIPDHVLVTGGVPGKSYYALTCSLPTPLIVGDHGGIDLSQYRTRAGREPGWGQRAALLRAPQSPIAPKGRLRIAFKTDLIAPWYVRLTDGRALTLQERQQIEDYQDSDDWFALVGRLRRCH